MAKWGPGVTRTEDRFFFSMFDKVWYLIPVEKQNDWAEWVGSNAPDVPDYAAACPGPTHMSFSAPKVL